MSCATAPALDELAVLRARVSEQAAEIAHLKLVIAKLRRMQFGRSSEQMDQMLGQLELSLEELETQRAERVKARSMTRRRTSARKRHRASRFPSICPVTRTSTCLRSASAPVAAGRSRNWARP